MLVCIGRKNDCKCMRFIECCNFVQLSFMSSVYQNVRNMLRASFLVSLSTLLSTSGFAQWNYPATKKVKVSDTYFGNAYADPYRWLENTKDKEAASWFKAQTALTDGWLGRIPGRDALIREWTAWDQASPPFYFSVHQDNGRVFYRKIIGGENASKLYWRQGWNGTEKLLFNPTAYQLQSTNIGRERDVTTLYSFEPSWDGKYVVLTLTRSGAEYSEIRVLNVDRGVLLPESISPSFGCYGWTPDSKGFFYDAKASSDLTRPDIKLHSKTRLHELGTDVASDRDFFSDESAPELGIAPNERACASVEESSPGYILGQMYNVQKNLRFCYAPISELSRKKIKWNILCERSDSIMQEPMFAGKYVYAWSDADAPRGKLLRTRMNHIDWKHAQVVIPEQADSIQYLCRSKHWILVAYSDGIVGRLVKYYLETGRLASVSLPASGTVDVTCPDCQSDRFLVSVTSWTLAALYDYQPLHDTFGKSIFSPNLTLPESEKLVSEEVEVTGHDGVSIPLSIIYQKGLPFDHSNSCILEGYGAYGVSATPSFSIYHSIVSHGVVYAYAHVRGGGEKGEDWHKDGLKTTKPNSWKDFISCAEYLVQQGYTSPQKLSATGGSAGGITVSRAIEERPDLFAAAVCDRPLVNPMRAEFTANGPGNIPEFGTVRDPIECKALFAMDGVQHVKKGVKYPALLCIAGWNDQRVPVWQAGKLAAAMQAASASGEPALLEVDYDSGHVTDEKMAADKNVADQFAFLLWQTGNKDFQPVN